MSGENFVKVVQERNDLIDALIAIEDWIAASQRVGNTAYPGDARKVADHARETYLNAVAKVQPLVEKRRNNGKA